MGTRIDVAGTKLSKEYEEEILDSLNRSYLEAEDNKLTQVRIIIKRIIEDKDAALLDILKQIEGQDFSADDIEVDQKIIESSQGEIEETLLDNLRESAARIREYHNQQTFEDWFIEKDGIKSGLITRPIEKVGIYVPGGGATYPSSLLMNAIPAQIAGVEEIVICTPANRDGEVDKVVLAAASLLGLKKIYKVGGAQAIAAMAYGTETIPKVDKITGPGNIYVTLAKKEVNGVVGIDMLAGPSEVLVLADKKANPSIVAADLLAQAEHGPDSMAIFVTDSKELADQVEKEVGLQLSPESKDTARRSLDKFGLTVAVDDISVGVEVVNIIAPEHLLIYTENSDALADDVKSAGAIFVGENTAVALGDYAAGPNHTLPTMGNAAFSAPLGVADFVKKTSYLRVDKVGLENLGPAVERIAEAEGLKAHAESVRLRRKLNDSGRK